MVSACCGALTIAISMTGGGACVSQTAAVAVLVLNEADVPANVIQRAERQAAHIYERLGVRLVWWNEAGGQRRPPFIIKIVATALSPRAMQARALGLAPVTGRRGRLAYAFYEHIRDFSDIHRVEVGLILGSVIAHELGHLLLPNGAHSTSGVMTSGWDTDLAVRAAKGLLIFSEPESTLIRNRVSSEFRESVFSDCLVSHRQVIRVDGIFRIGLSTVVQNAFDRRNHQYEQSQRAGGADQRPLRQPARDPCCGRQPD